MNLEFLTLPRDERNEIITECSARLGVPAVITEKDFWVCWMLGVLFQSSFADSLVFKGGTSLSKAFGAINRFSEDIDLSVSTEFLELPEPGDSRNQANKWMTNRCRGRRFRHRRWINFSSWKRRSRKSVFGERQGVSRLPA